MSFADDMREATRPKLCMVGRWAGELEGVDLDAFNTALSSDVDTKTLTDVMRRNGFTGQRDVVGRHRSKDCACVVR